MKWLGIWFASFFVLLMADDFWWPLTFAFNCFALAMALREATRPIRRDSD